MNFSFFVTDEMDLIRVWTENLKNLHNIESIKVMIVDVCEFDISILG